MDDQFVTIIRTKPCPGFHLVVSLEIRTGMLCLELIAKEGLQSEIAIGCMWRGSSSFRKSVDSAVAKKVDKGIVCAYAFYFCCGCFCCQEAFELGPFVCLMS